jgi:deoxycytidine triphosphate deaminase
MARIISGEKLIDAISSQTFIKGGNIKCAEGVKYDFRVSSKLLKASYKRPIDVEKLSEAEKAELFIEPGEMVFILTEERLDLSNTMMAELSPKRKLSHAGILAIGGFCIDPLYQGRLLIGLFNLSSTPFPIIPGKKVIAATFFVLEEQECCNFEKPEAALEDFPDELVQVMQKYRPIAMASITENIQQMQRQVDAIRKEIDSQNDWYKRFEGILDGHNSQIGTLIQGLNSEVKAREKGEDTLSLALTGYTDQIKSIEKVLIWLKGAAWVIGALLALVGVPIMVAWILKSLKLT